MYGGILAPTDGSDVSMRAVEHAIDLARAYDAALHALSVIGTEVEADATASGTFEAFETDGRAAIDEAIALAEAADLGTVEGSIGRGTPHRAILEYVDRHDVDLIVIGTHGRTGVERYLPGSVAGMVVRVADVPVLTVPLARGRTRGRRDSAKRPVPR